MKISDFIFRYSRVSLSRWDGICRVRIFVGLNQDIFAILTDLDSKNTGNSVTNSIETICENLIKQGMLENSATFIEHYESSDFRNATFDLVRFNGVGAPNWESKSKEEIATLLGCELSELQAQTLANKRLYDEIERIRSIVDPFVDHHELESPDVINRRAEIQRGMISKLRIASPFLLELIKGM